MRECRRFPGLPAFNAKFVGVKKLDIYILKKFLVTFFFCLLLMTAIVVVVDISEKTDDFIKSGLPAWKIVTDYYFGFIPRIDSMLFPLFTFISVIFFTSKMAGRTEIVAILSSGVTFRRFLRPYLVGGFLLSLLLWFGHQIWVPRANRKWSEFERNYVDVNSVLASYGKTSYKQNIFFREDPRTFIAIKGYDTISKTGNGFSMHRFKDGKLEYNVRALNFSWDSVRQDWKLQNLVERKFFQVFESVTKKDSLHLKASFNPRVLRKEDYLKDQMTTSELNDFIRLEKRRGSELINVFLVERHNRDAIPFSVLILTLIGAILASRKIRGGSGMHLAMGVAISMLYILAGRFTLVFATKGNLSPILAAWLPNLLFAALALYLYKRAPK
jgi:lipopolysaccharide export system permease protein